MTYQYDPTDEEEEDARAQAPADFQISQVKRNQQSAARDRILCLAVGSLAVVVALVIVIIHDKNFYGALFPAFGFGVVFLGLGALFTYQANAAEIEATRMEEQRAAINQPVDERDKHRTE